MHKSANPRAPRAHVNLRRGKVSAVASWSRAASKRQADAYDRGRDLPRLIPLWPAEVDDESTANCRLIIQRLRAALRAERRRGRSGHWSYDLNRHIDLTRAYRAELERLAGMERSAPAAPRHSIAAKR